MSKRAGRSADTAVWTMPTRFISSMCRYPVIAVLFALSLSAAGQMPCTGHAPRAPVHSKVPPQQKPACSNSLPDADAGRFRPLRIHLRAFDPPMQEVGQRYLALYEAINDRNWELADYQSQQIRWAIERGLIKRPARTANAEALFLYTAWPDMNNAIKSQDEQRIRQQFGVMREACIACHVAQKVPFMNDSPIFRNTADFPH